MRNGLYVVFGILAAAWLWMTGTPLRAQGARAEERIVARAGEVFVAEREFTERFELLPALYRGGKSRLEASKLELLYSMVAEKLLAQEAIERKLDQDPAFLSAFLELRKLLARDQLYREEVVQGVSVSKEEVGEERRRAEHLAHVAFLFFVRQEDAASVRSRIGSAEEFTRFGLDSSLAAIRDTATVIWGEADPAIEDAAFTLNPGDVSPVVRAGNGYYILSLLRFLPGTVSTRYTPEVFRERLEARIRLRKENRRTSEVIPGLLKGSSGYSRAAPFRTLAGALMNAVRAESTLTRDTMLTLTARVVESVRAECGSALADSLVVAGESRWSLGETLERLRAKRFQIGRERIGEIPAVLNGELEYWTQQELLGQEGIRRGLDRRPEVERRLSMWREALLAGMMKRYAESRVEVNDTEVLRYQKEMDPAAVVPEVNLRVLETSTLDEMQSALALLEAGTDLEAVVRTWSTDSLARENGGVTGYFPITGRPPMGELAASMAIGDRYGPLSLSGGFAMFELLGKRSAPPVRDTASVQRWNEARRQLTARKQQGLLNRFLAQVANARGVDIYADRLRSISVTPLPMLTFRILGFGGRMFEVPFVDPQLQWLNIEPPQSPVLP